MNTPLKIVLSTETKRLLDIGVTDIPRTMLDVSFTAFRTFIKLEGQWIPRTTREVSLTAGTFPILLFVVR